MASLRRPAGPGTYPPPAPAYPWRRRGLALAAGVLLLDQLVKWVVAGPLSLASKRSIDLFPAFALTWAENRGISYGLFAADSEAQRWLLVGVTAVIAAGVAVWLWREKVAGDAIALSLILGGAIGNIIDRVRFGYVVDFFDLHFGDVRPFAIFNVADAAISAGVVLLIARALFVREPDPDTVPTGPTGPSIQGPLS